MAKEMIAMLLAGGQGSRLYALTQKLAKPAVPFGGKYRIIDFPLSNCVNSGIDTVGILTQYQPMEMCIRDRCGQNAAPPACPKKRPQRGQRLKMARKTMAATITTRAAAISQNSRSSHPSSISRMARAYIVQLMMRT